MSRPRHKAHSRVLPPRAAVAVDELAPHAVEHQRRRLDRLACAAAAAAAAATTAAAVAVAAAGDQRRVEVAGREARAVEEWALRVKSERRQRERAGDAFVCVILEQQQWRPAKHTDT